MGYNFELQTHRDVFLSRQALVARLNQNNIPVLPESENTYQLNCGVLMIQKDKLMELGTFASIHISGASELDKWLSLFSQIEKLGCRLYDPATNRYVSKYTFEENYTNLVKTQNNNVIPYEVSEQKRKDATIEFKSVASMYDKIIEELRSDRKKMGRLK